jgi:hypothetical protein
VLEGERAHFPEGLTAHSTSCADARTRGLGGEVGGNFGSANLGCIRDWNRSGALLDEGLAVTTTSASAPSTFSASVATRLFTGCARRRLTKENRILRIAKLNRVGVVLLCLALGQSSAGEVRVPVLGGALVLPVPDGWRNSMKPGPLVPTVSLTPASGNAFQVIVSPLVASDGRVISAARESLRRLVEASADGAKSHAVEKALPIRSFGSGQVHGSYFPPRTGRQSRASSST